MAYTMKAGLMASAAQKRVVPVRATAPMPALPSRTALNRSLRNRSASVRPQRTIVRATGSSDTVDFDKILADIADKFEKSDNKAVIIGYAFAAVFALWVSEWLIHLPLLNILLGFPIQLIGLALIPYFSVKYFVDGESITGDAGNAFDRVVKKLPGLEK